MFLWISILWIQTASKPFFVAFLFCTLCLQLPMGDSHQGCNEEVPQPNEPECDWGGRSGAQPGWRRPSAQPQTPQHRVGPPSHRASGQSDRQTERSVWFYCLPHFSAWYCFLCTKHLFACIYDVFLDPGDQSDGDIRERTLYSWPGGEEDGAVLIKCVHSVLAHISMQRCAMWVVWLLLDGL